MFEKLTERIREGFTFTGFVNPVEWSLANINFRQCKDYRMEKLDFSYTPYLRDPVMSCDFTGKIRELTAVAPEQTGKSLVWLLGVLWLLVNKPCNNIICYPSDELAEKSNDDKLKPLMREIPALSAELSLPRSFKVDRYNFTKSTSYFMGAGSRVTSQSVKVRVADEVDDWITHEGHVTNLQDLRKRARSFSESLYIKVCSPTRESGSIWQEFLKSSKGYWHLRCLKCGELSLRSCDIHNLKFDVLDGQISNFRLVCPFCHHEHSESDKREMNINGAYIHESPELIDTMPGYQWGALASQWETLSWSNIAEAQLVAGKSGNMEDQIYFDNSIRGLPFKRRRINEDSKSAILKRSLPRPRDFNYAMLGIDTQDVGFWWRSRVWKDKDNFGVSSGFVRSFDELEKIWYKGVDGKPFVGGIIDIGGHRMDEVNSFIADIKGLFSYRGNSRIGTRYVLDNENARHIKANPRTYQAEVLYDIYSNENSHFFIEPDPPVEYIKQICDMRPALIPGSDTKIKKFGQEFENWEGSGNDHLFDCEKMLKVLNELYLKGKRKTKFKAETYGG